jgi:hypothetical protein
VRVIDESKWWIEVKDGESRHYGCRSRNSRGGEQHGWSVRKSLGSGLSELGWCLRFEILFGFLAPPPDLKDWHR